ncbi:MAG: DMT family transporter [Pseudomonadota bacterium]
MQKNNVRAAILIVVAMALITTNDAIFKFMSSELGVGQIIFVRGVLVCGLFAIVLKATRQPIVSRQTFHRWNMLRALFVLGASLSYLTGLSMLSLATTSTLAISSPIILAVLAALALRERVGVLRWLLVFIGFCGVVLIINPIGESFHWAVILPMICAVLAALRDLAVRFVPDEIPAMQIAFTHAWVVTLGGLAMAYFEGMAPMSWDLAPWFLLQAALVFGGYLCMVQGVRIGELSYVAPFKYTGVPIAFILGYLVWDDGVTLNMLLGAAVIVTSGIVLVTTENRRTRRAAMEKGQEWR